MCFFISLSQSDFPRLIWYCCNLSHKKNRKWEGHSVQEQHIGQRNFVEDSSSSLDEYSLVIRLDVKSWWFCEPVFCQSWIIWITERCLVILTFPGFFFNFHQNSFKNSKKNVLVLYSKTRSFIRSFEIGCMFWIKVFD